MFLTQNKLKTLKIRSRKDTEKFARFRESWILSGAYTALQN